jgi:LysM repeat protein
MKKTLYLLITLSLFTSCSVHHALVSNRMARQNNRQVQRSNSAQADSYVPLSSVQYIRKYRGLAIQQMNAYGIPASITLAQGLYESGAGNSELARVANNHFGVKAGASWSGKVYYKDDDNRNDAFRVYDSAEESYADHSAFLKKKNYAALFNLDITDYKGWARGLKKAGYATNPHYPEILINIIEKYNLQQYDQPAAVAQPSNQAALAVRDSSALPVQSNSDDADTAVQINPASGKTYIVKHGDTLYNISKRYGLSVDDLKTLNSLTDNTIKIGQVLVVGK